MSELAIQTLHVAAREINAALNDARTALEAHVEQPGQPALLERCAAELHQAQGALRVLEIYGAALLAEEMEQVTRYLMAAEASSKNLPEALDALMRAMVQLPGYLERVMAGGRDLALVLLPLLNDLRAVRGSALLSEGTLLLLNLKSDRQAQPTSPAPGEPPLSPAQWARRLRPRFQAGLVGWIRGERLEQNLEILATVATRLEQVATQQCVFQLWWVTGALLESLREHGVEGGVSVKRLLGLADREIRRLYEEGEGRYAQHPPIELLNNMLYYVARSGTAGPRVAAVRASFRLGELLPVDEEIEHERENLSAPSVKLMQTVAGAIREDLARVKDVLDIFVRRGGGQVEELKPQIELLRKIGDTLGVLGLGQLRGRVQEANARLESVTAGREQPDEATLLAVAAALIQVEDHLDDQLVGLILPRAAPEGQPVSAPGEEEADADFRQVQAAVLRECVINLARVKESIAQHVGGTLDAAGFDSWPELVGGVRAGLLMLGKARAVEIIGQLATHLRRVMQPGGVPLPGAWLDRLADAIVSLEYYIETLQAGRSDPWYMLDNAQGCLDVLGNEPVPAVPTVAPNEHTRTLRILPLPADAGDASSATTGTARALSPPVLAAAPEPTVAATGIVPDPDLLRLFGEEAHEEMARIQVHYPAWNHNPLEQEALATVRRSFHTLKGSGRMVGARPLSEFAWAVENLLNHLLDGTVMRSPDVVETLGAAVDVLPRLVAELELPPGALRTDVSAIVARAHALAAGRDPAATVVVPPPAVPVVAPAPVPQATTPAAAAAGYEATRRLTGAELQAMGITTPAPAGSPATAAADAHAASPFDPAHTTPALDFVLPPADQARESGARSTIADPLSWPAPAAAAPPLRVAPPPLPPEPTELLSPDLLVGVPAVPAVPAAVDAAAGGDVATGAAHDATLADIYARETGSHVATVRAWLARERPHPAPHVVIEEVYRACHTLAGSSKMAEARHGIRLAEPLNKWLRKSFDSGVGLVEGDLALIGDCMDAMEAVAARLDESTLYFKSHDHLRGRIAQADAALDARIGAAATGAHAALAPVPRPEPIVVAPVAMPVATPSEPARAPIDYDPEVAAIFCDEASELLETAQSSLQAWNGAPEANEHPAQLKRALHTFKGGARMAGILPMGDLSHELESLVGQIALGSATGDERARGVAQEAVDELARMREQVVGGRVPQPATSLIARIRAVARGAEAAELAPVPALAPAPVVPTPAGEPAVAPPASPAVDAAAPAGPPAFEAAAAANDALGLPALAGEEPMAQPLASEPAMPVLAGDSLVAGAPASAAPAAESAAAPLLVPPGREPVAQADRSEMARVSAELLDQLLNNAGEVSISRSRLEQQLGSIEFNLGELSRTVARLKEQLRKLELETEAQVLHRREDETGHRRDFDPLELDRYSSIQQYSRALAESASDVGSLQGLLEGLVTDAQGQLQQQSRMVTELQNGLMRTRMVSFQRHVQRLARIVRQTAADLGKQAELVVEGASGELDRQVLDHMLPAFEHILRNAVAHGIESPERRVSLGKPPAGHIHLRLVREGAEVVVEVRDDGAGMDLAAIRARGLAQGLIHADQSLSDDDVLQLVLEPGFTTATQVTQQSGRGVGMDVVATEVKKLGGALHMETRAGEGSRFTIRLPLTLAVSHALIVRTGDEFYALPLPSVEGVVRLARGEVAAHLRSGAATYTYGQQKYRFQPLAPYVGMEAAPLPEAGEVAIPVVLVRAGEHSTGLVVDELVGSREIVVKPVGPQVAGIRGISGATILGDGRVVLILDIATLVRAEWRSRTGPVVPRERDDKRTFALVVDDSITVRRVTQRLLERNGMRVLTARDGMDAVALLAEHVPDIILLDIEMPRMDGYEVAAHVRADPRTHDVPIIMITSRVGEKHRARAIELGVDDYLGKPYQESQLIDAIAPLVARRRPHP